MITDEMLVARTLNGELTAFEQLVERHKNTVFNIAYRMLGQYQEAEDITQDVFITVYKKLYQFDLSKRFAPWINKITVNSCISVLRKKKNLVSLTFDESFGKQYEEKYHIQYETPEHILERKQLREEINNAIMELNEGYRTVLVLRYQLEMNNQEIAEILNISKENVEVKIHRARKALRKILTDKWQERGIISELSISK